MEHGIVVKSGNEVRRGFSVRIDIKKDGKYHQKRWVVRQFLQRCGESGIGLGRFT